MLDCESLRSFRRPAVPDDAGPVWFLPTDGGKWRSGDGVRVVDHWKVDGRQRPALQPIAMRPILLFLKRPLTGSFEVWVISVSPPVFIRKNVSWSKYPSEEEG